jgi:hypothetical protein
LPEPDVSGPLTGPNGGYGPLATAKGYDLPVQHHAGNGNPWDGYGISVAVGMWGSISGTDIIPFMKYFGVQHRGKTYILNVDGGGTYGDPGSDEATLDTETIIGNAPGVDVLVLAVPDPRYEPIGAQCAGRELRRVAEHSGSNLLRGQLECGRGNVVVVSAVLLAHRRGRQVRSPADGQCRTAALHRKPTLRVWPVS